MYMDNYEKKKEMEAREKATKSKKKNANASASIITKKEAPAEKEHEDLIHRLVLLWRSFDRSTQGSHLTHNSPQLTHLSQKSAARGWDRRSRLSSGW